MEGVIAALIEGFGEIILAFGWWGVGITTAICALCTYGYVYWGWFV
jgi:hypothetical protein